jgi:hypothetical protein
MFLQTLKTCLINKLERFYNEKLDSFIGICSKRLPEIQKFLEFWENTIIIDENEMDFEIEEIVILFHKWCNVNNETLTSLNYTYPLSTGLVSETEFVGISANPQITNVEY